MFGTTATLPNFFVVGAPKAGTTSLYHCLDQHPEIYMSPIKEPSYFASEIRAGNLAAELLEQTRRDALAVAAYLRGPMDTKRFGGIVSEWEDYLRLFQRVRNEKAIGEASVCYLWSESAAANIAAKIPTAKIYMILRNPAERAFSQYLHAVTAGAVRKPFREHVQESLRRHKDKFGPHYPFLEMGLYSEQVRRFLQRFPGENVRMDLYEDFQMDPQRFLAGVFSFLGVESTFQPDLAQRYLQPRVPRAIGAGYLLKRWGLWQRLRSWVPGSLRPAVRAVVLKPPRSLRMDPRDKAYLTDYYAEDVRKLAALVNRDLSAWLPQQPRRAAESRCA
jgi:hypothetical protein